MLNFFKSHKKHLRELANNTYSPYTLRMLDSNLPVKFTSKIPAHNGGQLVYMPHTGKAKAMKINKDFMSEKYEALLIAEHEAVHYDQSVYAVRYNQSFTFSPDACCKIGRIKELEAYGRESYKLVTDFINGSISEKDISYRLQNPWTLLPFLEAQLHQSLHGHSADKVLHVLKKEDYKLSPETALTGFYFYAAQSQKFLDFVSTNHTLEHETRQMQLLLEAQKTPHLMRFFKSIKSEMKIEKFYQNDFTLPDADKILDRDGNHYLTGMSPEERECFWENISTFSEEQKKQIAWLNEQAEKLTL